MSDSSLLDRIDKLVHYGDADRGERGDAAVIDDLLVNWETNDDIEIEKDGTRKGEIGMVDRFEKANSGEPDIQENDEVSDDQQQCEDGTQSSDVRIRLQKFEEVISSDIIDIEELRQCSWNGVPDQYRAETWQHLLGYLPLNASRRRQHLKRRRDEYLALTDKYFSSVDESNRTTEEKKLIHQIRVDCPRTEPNLPLFKEEKIQQALFRLLVTWSFRNPATSYVQGMNDLVAVFFVVLLKPLLPTTTSTSSCEHRDLSDEDLFIVEADAYWCFTRLINKIQDHYTPDQPQIQMMIKRIDRILRHVDYELWLHFREEKVEIFHFAFKWINCFLSRELPLNAVIRLWDSLISDDDGFEILHVYVCVSLLVSLRSKLLGMNQEDLLQFLTQEELKMSRTDVEELLSQAYIWKVRLDKNEERDIVDDAGITHDCTGAIEARMPNVDKSSSPRANLGPIKKLLGVIRAASRERAVADSEGRSLENDKSEKKLDNGAMNKAQIMSEILL